MQASGARVEASLSNLTGATQHISNELDTVKLMTQAIQNGMDQLQVGMQQHTVMLHQVMEYCDKLGQGQTVIIDNQRMLMEAIVNIGVQAREGTKTILDTLLSQRMEDTQEKLELLQRCMRDHLQHPGQS